MPIEAQQPADERDNPFIPRGPEPLVCDQFMGINTNTVRAGVPDKQVYWSENLFPIAPRNFRTMYGIGSALYTAAGGRTVIFFAFYNIGATPYMAVFLDNGSVIQVNTNTSAQTTIMAAATITSPSITTVGTSQWGSQFLIITSSQTNGYWLWDGSLLYAAGTLSPTVTVVATGKGYFTTPAVIVTGGHGTGAVVVPILANGLITNATVTNPGSGYLGGDSVTLTLVGGNVTPSGGTLTAVMSSGGVITAGSVTAGYVNTPGEASITSTSIVAGGSNHSQYTALTVNYSWVGAVGFQRNPGVLIPTVSGGSITAVNISGAGSWHTPALSTLVLSVSITDPGVNFVSSVTVNSVGSNYSPGAFITFSGGSSPTAQATGILNVANGTITSVTVANGGIYAATSPVPTIAITDTFTAGSLTAQLMPFGIQGTGVETYQGRVWVINGPIFYWSAPGSFANFASSAGGGNNTSADSYLKVNYTQLINTNGFLWLIGDSSVNYISNVQTSGAFVTTFSNLNSDPQVGTPYPASVQTFGKDIWLANAIGVYDVNGGEARKISDDLDGVWSSATSFSGLQLSSAQAEIFGKKTYLVLSNVVDPVSGSTVNKLFCWYNKAWFPASQDVSLTYIKHQEINSVITVYGTDGSHVYPLFNTASVAIQKVLQTKLWDAPGGILLQKAASRWWGLADYNSTLTPNLIVSIDSEANAKPYSTPTSTYTITGPTSTGYFATPPMAVGQQGVLTGWTVKTNAADLSLVVTMMSDEIVAYRG